MNATELHLKDGRSAGIYFCEKCRMVAGSQHLAEQCCENYKCSTCGKDTGSRTWLICDVCRQSERAAKERERFAKAEKLTTWDGWVFLEGTGREGFHENLQEFKDDCFDDERPFPEYVWACKSEQFVKADFDGLMQHIEENGYEDFEANTLAGLDELKAALKAFEDANADVLSYAPDYTKAVLLNDQADRSEAS